MSLSNQRYFLYLAYQGTSLHGWQKQPNATTVQEKVEQALYTILREETQVVASGRTDTGVHAWEQVVHVDLPKDLNLYAFKKSLNSLMPQEIALMEMYAVKPEAHARFSASERQYCYQMIPYKHPYYADRAWCLYQPLDWESMQVASQVLLGRQDFECFSRKHSDVKHHLCTVRKVDWQFQDDGLVQFRIAADRFLRNMVRAMVGTLVEVGLGKRRVADMKPLLQSKDRSRAGRSAPAEGLFLEKITYPTELFLNAV